MAVGVLFLKPGENDTQEPHDSDEIYYILDGNGFLEINDESYRIKKGQAYFVAKDAQHHFYGNTKNLSVLYFFAGVLLSPSFRFALGLATTGPLQKNTKLKKTSQKTHYDYG